MAAVMEGHHVEGKDLEGPHESDVGPDEQRPGGDDSQLKHAFHLEG